MTTEAQVIVGAGLAGCAMALHLARAGADPLLLERTAQARPRLCGEFISTEAAEALAGLGVDVRALGGRPTQAVRVACGARVVEAALPFTAIGLTRQVLDGALQQRAVAAGVRLQRGRRVAVHQVAGPGRPFVLRLAGGDDALDITTPTLLLANGKTDLAPLARTPCRAPEPLVGLQTHLRLAPGQARAIEGFVEVLLFDGGYAGLQPVEGGRVNLCLLTRQPPGRGGLPALLRALQQGCPLLAERLQGATWPDTAPQAVYRVPYGHLHRAGAADPPGLWRLGDQAAVIPSFTGDGMAIALHSAALAAAEWRAGGSAARYHRRLHADLAAQMQRAVWLYRLGRARWSRGLLLALLAWQPSLLGVLARLTRVQ